ncbi:Rha family transcriptional regulator [Spirabiliibacterium pneumoniae]|uniref:Rha family transcriptional regulator n=1 Tax=Spirabiliibacterium pneumoniae TaxID=221400 RepID=UPI001F20DF86|nr:Rha family transcriptional regulator [Spirabiliibacterium pneumoniae]
MSSREIAELVDARHDSVKRTVERLQDKGLIQLTPLVEVKNHLGQKVSEYQLIKRDTYVVVAQLCPEFTARLVDRWQELERSANQLALPQNYLEALEKLVESEKEKQQLAIENKHKDMQIQSYKNYFVSGMTVPAFAKTLNGVNSQQINSYLFNIGWFYKDQRGNWRVTSKARDRFLSEQIDSIDMHGKEEKRVCYKPILLAKGASKLFDMYLGGKLPMKVTWNRSFTQDKLAVVA